MARYGSFSSPQAEVPAAPAPGGRRLRRTALAVLAVAAVGTIAVCVTTMRMAGTEALRNALDSQDPVAGLPELLRTPRDFKNLVCDKNLDTYAPLRYSPKVFPESQLYMTCYKAYLCCSGAEDNRCRAHNFVKDKCSECVRKYQPIRLKDESKKLLESGKIRKADMSADKYWGPEKPEAPTVRGLTFDGACWEAITFCNLECPRDGKRMEHEMCSHCIENYPLFRKFYHMDQRESERESGAPAAVAAAVPKEAAGAAEPTESKPAKAAAAK